MMQTHRLSIKVTKEISLLYTDQRQLKTADRWWIIMIVLLQLSQSTGGIFGPGGEGQVKPTLLGVRRDQRHATAMAVLLPFSVQNKSPKIL